MWQKWIILFQITKIYIKNIGLLIFWLAVMRVIGAGILMGRDVTYVYIYSDVFS